MTVSDTVTFFRYEGNGVTDTFTYSNDLYDTDEIDVYIVLRSDNSLVEQLTLTTDYTVTINSDRTASVVTVAGKIPSSTQDILLWRNTDKEQTAALGTGTAFPSSSVETSMDKLASMVQDIARDVGRAAQLSKYDDVTTSVTLPAPVADNLLAWNGTTGAIKGVTPASVGTDIDTLFSGLTANDILRYNGTVWVNEAGTKSGLSVIGVTGSSSAVPAAIVAATDGQVLRRSGSAVSFGQVDIASGAAITGVLPLTNGGTGQTTASGAFGAIKQAATDSATGVVEIAVQSEMEAGSSTTLAVTPGRQHYHPSAAKCWGVVTVSAGVPTLNASYNVNSITDSGVGILDVTVENDFSSVNYPITATIKSASATLVANYDTVAVGSFRITCRDKTDTLSDPAGYSFVAFGDL